MCLRTIVHRKLTGHDMLCCSIAIVFKVMKRLSQTIHVHCVIESMLTCMTIALLGSSALISWKFFTDASFTLPRKFRHQQRKVSFQCGGLFCSSTPFWEGSREGLRGVAGDWESVCEGVGGPGVIGATCVRADAAELSGDS